MGRFGAKVRHPVQAPTVASTTGPELFSGKYGRATGSVNFYRKICSSKNYLEEAIVKMNHETGALLSRLNKVLTNNNLT